MKKRLLYSNLLVIMALVMIAMPVLAATYYANIQVQETSGNSYTQLAINYSINNTYLADNGYINATGLDTRVITGAAVALPHLVADDKLMFVSSIGASSTTNLKYTFGNSDLSSMPIVTGYGGYITVPSGIGDTMQPGDDFEIEQKGWVDTSYNGAPRNLAYKESSLAVYVSAEEEITCGVNPTASSTTTVNLLPDAAGNYTNIASVFGETNHWEAVDDPVASPDNDTTYVYTASEDEQKDAYNLESGSVPDGASIASITVHWRWRDNGGSGVTYTKPYLRLGTDETAGTRIYDTDNAYQNSSEALARPGGGTWTTDDIADLQVAVGLWRSDAAAEGRITQVYIAIAYVSGYTFTKDVTVTGVASGKLTVNATADGTDMTLSVTSYTGTHQGDSPQSIALAGASAADNGNDWVLAKNNAMPYMEYYKHSVPHDTLIAQYQPIAIIDGTTLPDREGAAQDGTITWGSNPAGVAVSMGSLTSYAQPVPTGVVAEPGQDIVGETGQPGWTDVIDTVALESNPFYPIVWAASEVTDFSQGQLWLFMATFIVIAGMLAVISFVPHQLITVVVGGGLTGFFISMGIYPFWTIFLFILMGVAIVLWERVPSV